MSSIVEIVETPVFNASFAVTDLLMKTLENAAKSVAVECVKACGNQYGFNAEEAIDLINSDALFTRFILLEALITLSNNFSTFSDILIL